jgi:hypothetical protein
VAFAERAKAVVFALQRPPGSPVWRAFRPAEIIAFGNAPDQRFLTLVEPIPAPHPSTVPTPATPLRSKVASGCVDT